jgi:hypothetical protein
MGGAGVTVGGMVSTRRGGTISLGVGGRVVVGARVSARGERLVGSSL